MSEEVYPSSVLHETGIFCNVPYINKAVMEFGIVTFEMLCTIPDPLQSWLEK
jgi:hypothetical protein